MLNWTSIKNLFSDRQAWSRRQLLNHAAHAGILLLIAIPFLAGWSLPPRTQYVVLAILGFWLKETFEMERRRMLGEEIHRADSFADFAIAFLVILAAGILFNAWHAGILGAALTIAYIYFRWGRRF